MRLLLVTQDFPPDVGGIQTYSAELASRLSSRCDFFAVLAPRRPDAADVDRSLPFLVRRLPPSRPDLLPLSVLSALPVLARRWRIDVAFHAQWQTVGASLVARGLTGYPRRIVMAAHARELLFTPFSASLPRASYARLRRFSLSRVDRCLPVSQYTAGLLKERGVAPDRITVIPNGTDPERFHPCDASELRRRLGIGDRRVLLTVGRLVPRKGIDTILQALPHIIDAAPSLVYLIAGEGPDRGRLESLAWRLGVEDRVRLLGAVPHDELRHYYNACDVFVMPSREDEPDVEGFGIVFLEANACGKPVIGARSGGIPDAIEHEETGLLVPPDDPEALAKALEVLLTRPDYAERLGRKGRQRVLERFTWDHVAREVHAALSAAL